MIFCGLCHYLLSFHSCASRKFPSLPFTDFCLSTFLFSCLLFKSTLLQLLLPPVIYALPHQFPRAFGCCFLLLMSFGGCFFVRLLPLPYTKLRLPPFVRLCPALVYELAASSFSFLSLAASSSSAFRLAVAFSSRFRGCLPFGRRSAASCSNLRLAAAVAASSNP